MSDLNELFAELKAEIAERTYRQMRDGDAESARLHLESVKRILARQEPDYLD